MRGSHLKFGMLLLGGVVFTSLGFIQAVSAERFDSSNYTIDASVSNSFGGATESTSYKMEGSGGEAIVGDGSSGSYKLSSGYVSQLVQSIQLNVQPAGLAAYYPLDEPQGTAVYDSSVNSNGGVLQSTPVRQAGKVGQALQFDGTDDGVVFNTATLGNTSAFTVSTWVYTTANDGSAVYRGIVGSDSAATSRPPSMYIYNNTAIHYGFGDGTTWQSDTTSTGVITQNAWQHVALTYDGDTLLRLYVNGVLADSVTVPDNSLPASPIKYLGRAENFFMGSIDEAKVLTRALSLNEVKAEYDAGNAGVSAGLAFGSIVPGVSQSVGADIAIQTDASGYNLAFAQNQNLQSGSDSIGAIDNGGTIGSPSAWSEGTTTGLGFTLTAAPSLPVKWGGGANYAAIPGTATTFHSRSGYTGGAKDVVSMQYRVDVPTSQVKATYQNTVTYTGTLIP